MAKSNKPRVSEVNAYLFIKDVLREIGWNTRNPSRTKDGQVYTQGECLDHERIAECLGQTKPENIVKLTDTEFYVIEAKAKRNQIDLATEEAEEYAENINKSKHISVRVISGVAGNDVDGYLIKSKFLVGSKFRTIESNGRSLTSLVSPQLARWLMENKTNVAKEIPIDERVFLAAAERINVILHNGAIAATERGKVMSALLLSLVDDTQPNVNASPSVLIREINARVNAVLQREGKPEFYDYIRIALPTTEANHVKFKDALVKTIQELNNLNITSAMNSGTDILGNFYEVFLKYGNWAKEIGIVLTPRHITQFAVSLLDINHKDIIFDPTCGTGGFLVAAFDSVRAKSSAAQVARFKEHNIYGIEQEPSVVALAIVNMIFRGDGKNNIKEANCFHEWLHLKRRNGFNVATYIEEDTKSRIPPVTKVLMNPPFALKEDADKEYKFVDHALRQMQKGGLLFCILPVSEMLAKGQYRNWRKELLEHNTLLTVITFPPGLFYPIANVTCGIVVRKGVPHPAKAKVLWLRGVKDGFVIRKGKRLKPKHPRTERDILSEYRDKIRDYIADSATRIGNEPGLLKLAPVNFADPTLELVPEAYLDEQEPSQEEIRHRLGNLIRQSAAYLLTSCSSPVTIKNKPPFDAPTPEMRSFLLTDLCEIGRKYAPYMNEILSDEKITPYVTTTEGNNGISVRCDSEPNFPSGTVTVSLDGECGTTFFQFEDFIAGEKTAVLSLKKDLGVPDALIPHTMFYVASLIRHKSWRYHYGRKLSEERIKKFQLLIPATNARQIDVTYIKNFVESCYGWDVIECNLPKASTIVFDSIGASNVT